MTKLKSKYTSLREWAKDNQAAYSAACHKGFIPKICKTYGFPLSKRVPMNYWTKTTCREVIEQFTILKDFRKEYEFVYKKIKDNGWDDLLNGLNRQNAESGFWQIKANCIKAAKEFNTRNEFRKGNQPAYNSSRKNGWMEECCKHMFQKTKPVGWWTLKRCVSEAKKYKTRSAMEKGSSGAYWAIIGHEWQKYCFSHMEEIKKPNGYWTKEKCIEEAAKYKTKVEWQKHGGSSFSIASSNKWIEDCCKHMVEIKKPNGYWNNSNVLIEAAKYENATQFSRKSNGAYSYAQQNGLLDNCRNFYAKK